MQREYTKTQFHILRALKMILRHMDTGNKGTNIFLWKEHIATIIF